MLVVESGGVREEASWVDFGFLLHLIRTTTVLEPTSYFLLSNSPFGEAGAFFFF